MYDERVANETSENGMEREERSEYDWCTNSEIVRSWGKVVLNRFVLDRREKETTQFWHPPIPPRTVGCRRALLRGPGGSPLVFHEPRLPDRKVERMSNHGHHRVVIHGNDLDTGERVSP